MIALCILVDTSNDIKFVKQLVDAGLIKLVIKKLR